MNKNCLSKATMRTNSWPALLGRLGRMAFALIALNASFAAIAEPAAAEAKDGWNGTAGAGPRGRADAGREHQLLHASWRA